ncbi:MAG: hypothetical protein ACM3X9_08755 [Bacillota bacterium]
MKRTLLAFTVTLTLLLMVTAVALGNDLTLRAENGKILAPAGLGFEISSQFNRGADVTNGSPVYGAQVSYGISPAITIVGQFQNDFQKDGFSQAIIKALFSPTREGNGYTLYAGYDLNTSKIGAYGISLWYNSKYLYAFTNLEAGNRVQTPDSSFMITPGVNLRIGSKFRIGGELELKPENWSYQEFRAGVNYYFSKKIAAKLGVETDFESRPNRMYTAGLAVEL